MSEVVQEPTPEEGAPEPQPVEPAEPVEPEEPVETLPPVEPAEPGTAEGEDE